jgi:hypothetical protein
LCIPPARLASSPARRDNAHPTEPVVYGPTS